MLEDEALLLVMKHHLLLCIAEEKKGHLQINVTYIVMSTGFLNEMILTCKDSMTMGSNNRMYEARKEVSAFFEPPLLSLRSHRPDRDLPKNEKSRD